MLVVTLAIEFHQTSIPASQFPPATGFQHALFKAL
ncbi:uncharacterized protein METZ01_LOCUS425263 [marine metagenome]|uniref:Uncharacterized protein n=1 Tax=marine metagenome TaxID=408172 RepID=A0A382XNJ8_9ZZZZ